jgi:hypothetical protein
VEFEEAPLEPGGQPFEDPGVVGHRRIELVGLGKAERPVRRSHREIGRDLQPELGVARGGEAGDDRAIGVRLALRRFDETVAVGVVGEDRRAFGPVVEEAVQVERMHLAGGEIGRDDVHLQRGAVERGAGEPEHAGVVAGREQGEAVSAMTSPVPGRVPVRCRFGAGCP